MTDFLHWLLGIKSSPDWIAGESEWSIDFQNVPEGAWAGFALTAAAAAAVFIGWLYRREGRLLVMAVRLLFVALRGLILVGVAFMLLEMVIVITKRETIPSHL